MDSAIYAAHIGNVLKLAAAEGGVSKPQLVSSLNVTRAVASGLIEKAGLTVARKEGRTEYFAIAEEGAAPAPVPPKQSKTKTAVAKPVSADTGDDGSDDLIAELDAQIVDTRGALREAADKAGKALGEWATHSALVDALRERMTGLAIKRMNASS